MGSNMLKKQQPFPCHRDEVYSAFETEGTAVAGVARWIECQPANQRVASSITQSGHMPGLQARSLVGGAQEATTH